MFNNPGFLGTNATLLIDLTLIAEILFYLGICIAVVAQRRKLYKVHDTIQTPIVILNAILVAVIMITSFSRQQVATTLPQRPTDLYYLVVAIHALFGLVAALLSIYCLLAGHAILPRKFGRLRYVMWATFVVWTLAFLAGIATYYVWYVQEPEVLEIVPDIPDVTADSSADAAVDPVSDEPVVPQPIQLVLQDFEFAPNEVTILAGTEVSWINADAVPHNVTFIDGTVASDNYFQGESFSSTFAEPGEYPIYCTLHSDAEGNGMSMVVTVIAADDENAAQVAAAPIPTPTAVPPTPAPTVEAPPVALIEPEEPTQRVLGLVAFFDSLAASDGLNIQLSGLEPPAAGFQYEGWLVNTGTGDRTSLGVVTPDANGRLFFQIIDEQQRNLLTVLDRFEITQEPQFDDDPTPGPLVYAGQQPPQALDAMLNMLVAAEDAPQGYSTTALQQAAILQRHADFLATAHELLSIGDSRRYAEQLLNMLEGEQGENFGDLDGLHGAQNPGDGFGLIPYVQRMQETAVAAANAPDATNAIQIHHTHVVMSTDNALASATQIRDAALQITQAASVADIDAQVATIVEQAALLRDGLDANGDGAIAPAEGGIFTAYQHGQYMAAIGVLSQP